MADLVLRGRSKDTMTVELAGTEYALPGEIPTVPLILAARALLRLGRVTQGEETATASELHDDMEQFWRLAEDVLGVATPSLPGPVREELGEEDVLALAGFLAMKFKESQDSKNSSALPTSSEEPSQSSISNGTQGYTLQPVESLSD